MKTATGGRQHTLKSAWLKVSARRRLAAIVFAVALAGGTTANTANEMLGAALFVLAVPVMLAAGLPLAWLSERIWEAKTHPAPPAFCRKTIASSQALRQDRNAGFFSDRKGFLWDQRHWFVGTGCRPVRLRHSPSRLFSAADEHPVRLSSDGSAQWWLYRDVFYVESDGLSLADVKALVEYRAMRRERQLKHAHAVTRTGREAPGRQPIPEEVRRRVFQRDGGSCLQCGSRELIQFDHVIPVALGGSNEPENLQLLCAPCNRAKGARL